MLISTLWFQYFQNFNKQLNRAEANASFPAMCYVKNKMTCLLLQGIWVFAHHLRVYSLGIRGLGSNGFWAHFGHWGRPLHSQFAGAPPCIILNFNIPFDHLQKVGCRVEIKYNCNLLSKQHCLSVVSACICHRWLGTGQMPLFHTLACCRRAGAHFHSPFCFHGKIWVTDLTLPVTQPWHRKENHSAKIWVAQTVLGLMLHVWQWITIKWELDLGMNNLNARSDVHPFIFFKQ